MEKQLAITKIVYALQAASFLIGITAVVAGSDQLHHEAFWFGLL